MAKSMTKTEMQQKIDELNERLNLSNEAYMGLQRQYAELNEQKGNVTGFKQLKEQYNQLEIRYNCLNDSLEHEKKQREQLKTKYQSLYTEHEKLRKSISINNNDYMILIDRETVSIADLNDIFSKMGIETVDLDSIGLRIKIDTQMVKNKLKRNAGREKKQLKSRISIAEIRERMKKGEKVEDLAKEIGVSRATLFRKMKESEEKGYEYIS